MNSSFLTSWSVWQLIDTSFPSGSFAHSGGLEAAVQAGRVTSDVKTLRSFLHQNLEQTTNLGLPILREFYNSNKEVLTEEEEEEEEEVVVVIDEKEERRQRRLVLRTLELDALSEALLITNHVARRASVASGLSLLSASSKAFLDVGLDSLRKTLVVLSSSSSTSSSSSPSSFHGHLYPLFGLICFCLGIDLDTSLQMLLFTQLRNALSSAIRLNIIGPFQAQSLQHELASTALKTLQSPPPFFSTSISSSRSRASAAGRVQHLEVFQTSPLLDILQGTHDTLYSKLFNT